jgi:hypothetical protein
MIMNHHRLPWFGMLLSLAGSVAPLLSGCGGVPGADVSDVSDETIDKVQDNLYILTTVLWPLPVSGSRFLSVCFEETGFATERQWVRDAIDASWGAPGRIGPDGPEVKAVVFTGWNTCGAGGANLRIHFADAGGFTSGIGSQLNNKVSGVNLNTWVSNPSCGAGFTRDKCVKSTAAHEFGHALGFAHEQNRSDRNTHPECTQPAQGSNGNVTFGAFDMQSVMNYCNPVRNAGGVLSPTDIGGFQKYYGPFFDSDGDPNLKTYFDHNDVTNRDGVSTRSGTFYQCKGANEVLVGIDQRDGTHTIQCRPLFGTWDADIAGRRTAYSNSGIFRFGAASCPYGFAAVGVDFVAGMIKCYSVRNYNGSNYESGGGDYTHFFLDGIVHEIHTCPTGAIQGANVLWPNPPRPDQVGFDFNCVNSGG